MYYPPYFPFWVLLHAEDSGIRSPLSHLGDFSVDGQREHGLAHACSTFSYTEAIEIIFQGNPAEFLERLREFILAEIQGNVSSVICRNLCRNIRSVILGHRLHQQLPIFPQNSGTGIVSLKHGLIRVDIIVEQELHRIYQGILIDNNIRLETLLTQQGIHLKPDQSYAVMLMRDSSQEMTNRWQQAFRDRFHVPLSIGVGNAHPISDLHKSFHEARIALTFRTIKGHEGFVQWFRDLGIFGNLFSSPAEDIRAFCRQTLDKLLEYDHDYDTELQLTLRTLLDENFNYKLTAEKLFIHVNTVRYRAEKIAQLLNIDLNSPDVRFNLYAAIRIGDVLKKLDLMQPGYIGTIHTHNDKHHTKTSKTIF